MRRLIIAALFLTGCTTAPVNVTVCEHFTDKEQQTDVYVCKHRNDNPRYNR